MLVIVSKHHQRNNGLKIIRKGMGMCIPGQSGQWHAQTVPIPKNWNLEILLKITIIRRNPF